MDINTNTIVPTHNDLERLWAEQCRLTFVAAHATHMGGVVRFDSGVGMVSHTTAASYPHPANSTVGYYPSFNEVVSSPTSPIKWKSDDRLDLYPHVEWSNPSRRAEVQ